MSKLSKVLSVLLAMVLLFSTASVGVEAAYNAYKDNAISRYDSIDKPVLTPAQYASMAMDEVDRMLAEANQKIEYDLAGLVSISADFTSVDKALDSIADVYNSVKSLLPTIGGDVQQINFSALVNSNGSLACPKRGTAGKTDADIFLSLVKFLADNASIIAKVPKGAPENGGLDLGILSGFVKLEDKLNIPKLVKEKLAALVWPNLEEKDRNLNLTVDQYIQTFLDLFFSNNYPKDQSATINELSELVAKYLPGIADQIDLLNDSVYDIFSEGVKILLNAVAIPYLNPRIKAALNRLCGYDYIKTTDEDGDTIWVRNTVDPQDDVNALVNVVNTNFNLAPFPVESWGNDWIFDHLNDIVGLVIREAINPDINFTWNYADGNEALLDNIIAVAKTILKLDGIGEELFASYVEVLSAAQIDAMDDDEFVAYVLRSILNGAVSFVYIPNTCTTLLEVLFDFVKTLAADLIPSRDYSNLDADLDNLIQIGLDVAAYGFNTVTDMDLEYDMDLDDFMDACVDWAIGKYGGFLETINGTSGWEKISYVLFNIIPANWLSPNPDGSDRDDVYELIFTDIVDNVLDFNVAPILSLLDQNPDGELNGTIIEVLLARLTGIVNFVLPGVFPDREYKTLETLLDANLMSTIIQNLLTKLYNRVQNGLLDALIPVVCAVLGLSDAESFGYPYISLEDQHTVGAVTLSSFYVYNGSGGINTNATDKYGNTPQTPDKLYTYYIRSVTTNNSDVTVSPSSNIYINGGTSQTFTLNGVDDAVGTVLKVTITYDVLGEKGTVITKKPLTATTYTYIFDTTTIAEDNERIKADTTPRNTHLVYYKPTTYLSADSKLGELEDYSMDLQRNKYSDSSLHNEAATFSVDRVVLDSNLSALGVSANTSFKFNTTWKGGSEEYKPYKVAAANTSDTIPEGSYTNNFWLKATPTEADNETISFSHNIFVYNDYGLSSLLKGAVNADRQKANYGTGIYEAEYPAFTTEELGEDEEPEMIVESVNGAAAWDRYVEAVDAAAAIVYAPRQIGTMQNFVDNGDFEIAATELYTATRELEACSESSGTAGIRTALEAIVAPDTFINEYDEEERYDYDDTRRTYFGRADYISYTYSNFKSEMRAAERVLDAEKAAIRNGNDYQIEAIRAAYLAHRVSLYGERLIRIRAYKTHLNKAINDYTDLFNAGQGTYSNKTWKEFTRAYNFAVAVNAEPIGSTISGSENLANDGGLRQTKVNEARTQLLKAAKRLAQAKPLVDYTQINAMIAQAESTFEAGNADEKWTDISWSTFVSAYRAAVKIVEAELEMSVANQRSVNEKYDDLFAAFNDLEAVSAGGDWSFDDSSDIKAMITDISESAFVTGLDMDYVNVSDFLVFDGAYEVEVELNDFDMESTGAVVKVYESGVEVASFEIVLYGDVNGDGPIDGNDISEMYNAMGYSGLTEWEDFAIADENPYAMAADLNHDLVLDTSDTAISEQIQGFTIIYNQAWAEGDEIYEDF